MLPLDSLWSRALREHKLVYCLNKMPMVMLGPHGVTVSALDFPSHDCGSRPLESSRALLCLEEASSSQRPLVSLLRVAAQVKTKVMITGVVGKFVRAVERFVRLNHNPATHDAAYVTRVREAPSHLAPSVVSSPRGQPTRAPAPSIISLCGGKDRASL